MADTNWNGFATVTVLQTADIFLAQRGSGGINFTAGSLANYVKSTLGSMASQNASAVNITGGNATFDNAVVVGNFGVVALNDAYLERYHSQQGVAAGFLFRRSRGTREAPSAVLTSDTLGGIYITGYNSSSGGFSVNSASFYAYATEDYTGAGWGSECAVANTNIGGSVRITRVRIGQDGVYPGGNNIYPLGLASARWTVVYAATGTINTSDERTKQDIGAIPEAWLDAWGDLDWQRYKFLDAVQAKGAGARWHIGLIAQAVRDAFASRGLDGRAIGLLCHDEWDAREEQLDEDGNILREARDAGDRWGLRYDECLAMEAAWQRRELARKDALIAELFERIEALEG